jgi:uncharacterized protein (TIGR02246 family)
MTKIEISGHGTGIQKVDQQAVLQLPADLDRAWNERDAQSFAALFDEDGDFRLHTGLWIQGKDAIERFWAEEVFPTLSERMQHVVTPKRVRFVASDVAIGDGTLRLVDHLEEQERVHLEVEGTMLLVKREGRWRISAIRLAALASG